MTIFYYYWTGIPNEDADDVTVPNDILRVD